MIADNANYPLCINTVSAVSFAAEAASADERLTLPGSSASREYVNPLVPINDVRYEATRTLLWKVRNK